MPYPQVLQTITTICSVIGAVSTLLTLILAHRIHGAVKGR